LKYFLIGNVFTEKNISYQLAENKVFYALRINFFIKFCLFAINILAFQSFTKRAYINQTTKYHLFLSFFQNNFTMKIWKVLPLVALVSAAIFTQSCGSDPVVAPTVYGKLMAIHAAVDAPKVAVVVDGKTATAADSLAYSKATSYLDILSNATKRVVSIFVGANAVLTDSAAYNIGRYTIIAYRDSGATKPLRLSRAFPDDTTAPAATKAHLRVGHFSPDIGNVDILVSSPGQASNTVLLSNVSFKNIITAGSFGYTPVPFGTYDVKIRRTGATTIDKTISNVTFAEGKIYTVVARGYINTANSFDLTVVQNN
jgi:hypothetical protein